MAVIKVRPGEIVEVPFLLPGGEFKAHPALVVSPCRLQDDEDGYFDKILEKIFYSIFDVELEL